MPIMKKEEEEEEEFDVSVSYFGFFRGRHLFY